MPDKDAIRSELEVTRAAYHALLRSLSNDDWTKRSGNSDLRVKELVWHVAWAMGFMARVIEQLRRGRGSTWLPGFLEDPARKLVMRWQARSATSATAARTYDAGHAALLAGLDAVGEEEWSLSANRFGRMRTVEWYFKHPTEHFQEHAHDVREVLTASGPLP